MFVMNESVMDAKLRVVRNNPVLCSLLMNKPIFKHHFQPSHHLTSFVNPNIVRFRGILHRVSFSFV